MKQTGYRYTYVFGAVNPLTGESSGLVCSECTTEVMNIHLSQISAELSADTHVILVADNASWHSSSKDIIIPANISILDLPPYSPQLNPIERLWQWLKDHFFSNIVIGKDEDLDDLACIIWNKLNSSIIKSVCNVSYLKRIEPLLCL